MATGGNPAQFGLALQLFLPRGLNFPPIENNVVRSLRLRWFPFFRLQRIPVLEFIRRDRGRDFHRRSMVRRGETVGCWLGVVALSKEAL